MVAFTISAIAISLVYQIYSKGATAAILGKNYAEALIIAESQMALMELENGLADSSLSGVIEEKYEWQMLIRDYDPLPGEADIPVTPSLNLKEIQFDISWRSLGNRRSISLYSLRPEYRPGNND